MFTGIIQVIGEVASIHKKGDTELSVVSSLKLDDVVIGASIACNGICLTVTAKEENRFFVQMSQETLDVTTAGSWRVGAKLNLERALRMGDELGGHMVLGHVDDVARIVEKRHENESLRLRVKVPSALAPFVARKGSVALDGVSLTVNEVDDDVFGVNIIPHTQKMTGFGFCHEGDLVNIEVDMAARYMARMLTFAKD